MLNNCSIKARIYISVSHDYYERVGDRELKQTYSSYVSFRHTQRKMSSQSYPRLQFIFFSLFLCLFITPAAPHGPPPGPRRTCTVETHPNSTDDAPAIIRAFEECGHGGQVVFLNQTYHVNSVMNTTGLEDCEIDLHGTLLVCDCSIPIHCNSSWLIFPRFRTVVGHQYHLLAEPLLAHRVPEPDVSVVPRGRPRSLSRLWLWHLRWQRSSVV